MRPLAPDALHPEEIAVCRTKTQYPTRIDALLKGADRERDCTAYKCKCCRYWHLTTADKC